MAHPRHVRRVPSCSRIAQGSLRKSLGCLVSLAGDGLKAMERLWADVVLDPFRVNRGDLGWNPDADQELKNHFMAFSTSIGQPSASRGQADRLVRIRLGEPLFAKPGDGTIHRDVADSEAFCKVDHAAFPAFGFQLGYRLHVVLCNLSRMVPPGTAMRFRRWSGSGHETRAA